MSELIHRSGISCMSTAKKYQPHDTVEDYQHWDGDWELWNGVAVAMTPSPFGRHASANVRIASALDIAVEASGCRATVLAEIDWIISRDTILRPDVSVVCGGPPEKHVEEVPALVVEILSASTRERDLTFKKQIYQEQAVPWYLMIDPDANTLQALRLNSGGEYQLVDHAKSLVVDICSDCSLDVRVDRLFS
ncbi:MAG: Uma2 family endonuclease [Planctomycetaceae bacterium]